MPIEFGDVLKANIVLAGVTLLSEQAQRDELAKTGMEFDLEQVISGPVLFPSVLTGTPVNAESGLALHLRRDRIQVVSLPTRTLIEREYPAFDDLERLADVAGQAIDLTDLREQKLTAFGFNIDRVYRPPGDMPSEKYLGERLFPHLQPPIEGFVLAGGGGRVTFGGEEGILCTATMEPRANDPSGLRVFLSLNLHKNRQQAPNRDEILDSLQQVWARSQDFAVRLDAGA